ncbi:hypothetical protein TSUD_27300 [Trifolium subterraneum]|uniref:HMG box domain-containing protein n=1 Tax=Trifolium subterraneum TaxID=3900 RepID=A0A2Z6LWB2_TRISU|nr:hypothetical protein TSUD_27300 [Trifolium subterraneum]
MLKLLRKLLKKNPKSEELSAKRVKVGKGEKVKDPNMLKHPPTAFFVFMDDFRKKFKEANYDSKDGSRRGF